MRKKSPSLQTLNKIKKETNRTFNYLERTHKQNKKEIEYNNFDTTKINSIILKVSLVIIFIFIVSIIYICYVY